MIRSKLSLIAFFAIGTSAYAQGADCNALARDLVVKNFNSSSSDYSKLLFLSSLTQMDEKSASEAISRSGKVKVGPISIGPGTWNNDKKEKLRSELEKFINVDQIRQSAASLIVSSGDASSASVVESCLRSGGFFVKLQDFGKNNATAEITWTNYPTSNIAAVISDITVVNGSIVGGASFAKDGAELKDKLTQTITIKRDDPKQDLLVVANTKNAGSSRGYLPPSELPPAPPPKLLRVAVEGDEVHVGSGERYDGWRNPGCQEHVIDSCVKPQHGGKIVIGTGSSKIVAQSGRVGSRNPRDSSEQYCVTFWANTTACETPVSITGRAIAVEEYTDQAD
ncbi:MULTISPECIES: hypothetical protein [Methylobacterium]|uniref:hypothetical protein n=1 Tax=Methylobacterium TaxID=407 RepID=UPI0013E9B4CC|nr:hypothetical protein [Methylobacterium sp. DB0501]NGM33340.1 hypothetical protein [Methylobacterium sp. DB0501]